VSPRRRTTRASRRLTTSRPHPRSKQELSFKRAEPADAVEGDAVADPPAEETVWKKEVSFGRKVSREDEVVEAEPVVAEGATDEVAPDEQSADPLEQVSNPSLSPREGLDEGSLVQPRAGRAER
jgi:hypothetical protein